MLLSLLYNAQAIICHNFGLFPESLKDLVRFLRRDDTTCEIRRQLGYSEVLQNVCCFSKNIITCNNNDIAMIKFMK